MRVRGAARLQRYARRGVQLLSRRAVILMYHRIAEPSTDLHGLCVSPRHFLQQLDCLKRGYNVISLSDLTDSVNRRRVPPGAVALTFDDGYADNLYCAKPLLEKYEMPATFFIATGYLGGKREYWWDELERLVLSIRGDARALEVSVRGVAYNWALYESSWAPDVSDINHTGVAPPSGAWSTLRVAAHRELHSLLLSADCEDREAILSQLRRQCSGRVLESEGRVMTETEVCQLAAGGMMEVGAHTETHRQLASLSSGEQEREMVESKRKLEDLLAHRVDAFCYPFGREADVGSAAPFLARKAGFRTACTATAAPVTYWSDSYRLPRFLVANSDGDSFDRFIGRAFYA